MKKVNKLMVEKETMVVEMQQGARSNYHKRSTRKNANSMAISSLQVKSVKPQHHLTQSKVSKTTTTPHKKVKNVRKLSTKRKLDGYRLVDMDIFSNIINCLACPKCFDNNMVVEENYEKKKGLASFIQISCNNCEFSKESYTSKNSQKRRS